MAICTRRQGGVRFRFTDEGAISANPPEEGKITLELQISALVHRDAVATLDAVNEIAQEVFGQTPIDFHFPSTPFERIRSEATTEELPGEERHVVAAQALLPKAARSLAIAIKSSRGGLLASDAVKHVESDSAGVLNSLVAGGLISQEIVVVCVNSGSQVARVPTVESLVSLAEAGLRCGACGESIDKEKPEQLYAITELGVLLIDKSRWMSVLVRHELTELGVPKEDVLLECQLGTDEIDCIALISGEMVLFELKDKAFSIGNAYSFGAKMSIVRPEHSLIVTTELIATDVKEHFARTNASGKQQKSVAAEEQQSIRYLEGPGFLDSLSPLVTAIYAKDGERLLGEAFTLNRIGSRSLVNALQLSTDLDIVGIEGDDLDVLEL